MFQTSFTIQVCEDTKTGLHCMPNMYVKCSCEKTGSSPVVILAFYFKPMTSACYVKDVNHSFGGKTTKIRFA